MNTRLMTCLVALFVAGADPSQAQVTLNIERQGTVHWSHSETEYVVLATDSIDGPWALWPNIIYSNGERHWTEVTSGGSARFYALATGHQFYDAFDGSRDPWTDTVFEPADSSKWSLSYPGALRIQYAPGTTVTAGRTVFCPPEEDKLYRDVILSLDILDWDENASRQTIGIIARLTDWGYIGRINFNDPSVGGRASLAISLANPLVRIPLDVDPQQGYRMVFALAGDQLELSLFELSNLTRAVAALSTRDGTRPGLGKVGVWVNANWGESTMDTTVDNFVVTEKLP